MYVYFWNVKCTLVGVNVLMCVSVLFCCPVDRRRWFLPYKIIFVVARRARSVHGIAATEDAATTAHLTHRAKAPATAHSRGVVAHLARLAEAARLPKARSRGGTRGSGTKATSAGRAAKHAARLGTPEAWRSGSTKAPTTYGCATEPSGLLTAEAASGRCGCSTEADSAGRGRAEARSTTHPTRRGAEATGARSSSAKPASRRSSSAESTSGRRSRCEGTALVGSPAAASGCPHSRAKA